MTALVLYACSHVDATVTSEYREALQSACQALASEIDRQGCVANQDSRDYPNYASAMLLIAAERLDLQLSSDRKERLVEFLLESQIDEGEGYKLDDPDYGGWDMEGSSGGPRVSTGSNISVGAAVAEALALQNDLRARAALDRFRDWLGRCQNLPGDGGFFFHAQRGLDGNKAGWIADGNLADRTQPRSYGSATADGLRSLKAGGTDPRSEPMRAAISWLENHPSVERVPGFEYGLDTSWSEGLRYYYWFALAKSLDAMPDKSRAGFARAIVRELTARQSDDGSWQNENARMREDDPLIATTFAVIALSISKQMANGDNP